MDTLQAILLGIVQGITEFLPVSSSGHLQIAKELLGVELEENLTFDVALHAATVLSTIVVLWSEVWRLLKGLFSRRFNAEQAYVLKLVLSMIPIGFVGFLFKDRINALLDAPYILVIVGAMLLLTAALLAFAYYAKPRQKETISYRDAFIIGLAQACAAMPGLSRSGTTIATGLLLGNKKAAVAQFSFLMVLAPILGETLLEAASGDLTAGIATGTLAAGFAASFITGCLACKFMIEIVKRGKLIWFALYCAAAAIVGGLAAGVLLSKLVLLLLLQLSHLPVEYGFEISLSGMADTAALFGFLFLLTLVWNLFGLLRSRPVELLHSASAGEREPRTRRLLVVLGAVTLGAGYATALTVEDPFTALAYFFLAVALVMVGTYCLFTAGSIALLKHLRNSPRYYYQPKHFTAVAGLLYRMKQNAVGLANICILSTMVLVTVSTTVSLYAGLEGALERMYPYDVDVVQFLSLIHI